MLRVFAHYELLAISEILTGQTTHTTSARTAKDTVAVLIDKTDLLSERSRNLSVNAELSRLAAREALTYQRQLVHVLKSGVKERLIAILLELDALHGLPVPEGHLINLELTNTALAEMVGCTMESVSLAMCELRKKGLLLRTHGHIILRERQALEQLLA